MMMQSSSSPYYPLFSFGLFVPVSILCSLLSQTYLHFTRQNVQLLDDHQERHQPSASLVVASNANNNKKQNNRKKVAIVTGSNTGIGYETARCLVLDHGMTVILACRSRDKAQQAADRINNNANANADTSSSSGGKALFVHPLDLSSFESIKEFSNVVKAQYPKIDILINNAGRNTSGECNGLDLLFLSNFLGHYLLTSQLMDALLLASNKSKASRHEARIVNLSSVMHHFNAGHNLESVEAWKACAAAHHAPKDTYALSKLAAIFFTMELNRQYKGRIKAIAVNPGAVNSDIWRDYPRFLVSIFHLIFLTPRQGCQTSVAAAVGEFLDDNDNNSNDDDDDALYLQPYWLPSYYSSNSASSSSSCDDTKNNKKNKAVPPPPPFPPLEMLGPFQGHRITTPRLPVADGGMAAASALWQASQEMTNSQWPSSI